MTGGRIRWKFVTAAVLIWSCPGVAQEPADGPAAAERQAAPAAEASAEGDGTPSGSGTSPEATSLRPEEIRFEEIAGESGIDFSHALANFHEKAENVMPWVTAGGSGVSIADFDNDGWDDLYFTTSLENAPNGLYRNEGGSRFKNVGARAGLADVNRAEETGTSAFALWLDYDNDGWQDLFLLRFGRTSLFRNEGDGTFEEVTDKAGVRRHMNSLAAAAFDYDRDGDLDLYIAGYFPEKDLHRLKDSEVLFESWETARNGGPNVMFRNDGDGTFTDVTGETRLDDTGWGMAVGHGDFDNDGWQDIYVANDFGTDKLFRNQGDGTFEDVSREAIGIDTKKGMNAEVGDYNNDGFLDIYVTNMTEPYLYECNMLWKNNRDGTFTDVSQEEGACDTGWGWGAKFLDADNDGWLDLYAVNGFISAGEVDYMEQLLEFIFLEDVNLADASVWPPMGNASMAGYERNVFLHRTPGGYRPISERAGVDHIADGRGVAVADLDRDGRMDMVVSNLAAPPLVYRNATPQTGNWIELRLEGNGETTNRSAIGSRVELRTGLNVQIREVAGGNGFNAQSTLLLHYGVGRAAKVDEISVRWTDGQVQTFRNIDVNRIYHLRQGSESLASVDEKAR